MKKRRNYQTPRLKVVNLEPETIVMAGSASPSGGSFSLHGQLHGTGTTTGGW